MKSVKAVIMTVFLKFNTFMPDYWKREPGEIWIGAITQR